jgi:hypothetical protein
MSFPTLQQFENHSEHILRNALLILERGEDINALELQVEHLALLLSMYTRVEQFYDNVVLQRKFNEINFLKARLEQRIQFLSNDINFASRNFVTKKLTGGRPRNEFNEDVIKLLHNRDLVGQVLHQLLEYHLKL